MNSRKRRPFAFVIFLVLVVSLLCVCGSLILQRFAKEAAEQTTSEAIAPIEWDEQRAPNYYEVIGPANFEGNHLPPATTTLEPGDVAYGELDQLGRATGTVAYVDAPLMEAGRARERESVSDLSPSGWGYNEESDIVTPTGDVYHGFFWNRSHLLAKSLGGEEVIENLVCGTRMQNVGANLNGTEGGMAYPESLARDWLEQHPDGTVRYAATPIYHDDEAVCRCVVVDVLSSDGAINCEVMVYNAAKGYAIDYRDGSFRAAYV